jgi:hypothetical protein
MTPEPLAALAVAPVGGAAGAGPLAAAPAGAAFSLNDVARFESYMAGGSAAAPGIARTSSASPVGAAGLSSTALRDFIGPLDKINSSTERFVAASDRIAQDPNVGPGAMLITMVNAQRFMLECQLTSSVANRASDGIQELFRQQS